MFGAESRARSIWIPVRHAADAPGGATDPITPLFAGTDLATGDVLDLDVDGVVDALTPLAGTFDDVYLRNPALLREYAVKLTKVGNAALFQRFDVAAASYDARRRTLTLTVDAGGPTLAGFGGGAPATVALVPRNLRLSTGGIADFLPTNHGVSVLWQGAGETPAGLPDEASPLTGWTGDASQLAQPGLAFYRFEVVFTLGPPGAPFASSIEPPVLDFLRLPIRF